MTTGVVKHEQHIILGVQTPKNIYAVFQLEHINMVEYHVDCCHLFQDRMNKETKFGGELSMQKNPQEKALIMFGHDEFIFKQYTMSTKSWIGPNGETEPVPKDDGQGIMISAFQSREFGFGLDLTPDLLQEVNFTRQGKS